MTMNYQSSGFERIDHDSLAIYEKKYSLTTEIYVFGTKAQVADYIKDYKEHYNPCGYSTIFRKERDFPDNITCYFGWRSNSCD